MDVKYDGILCCKISVMGSAAVGKTAIINRLVNNYFPIIYEPTINIENYTSLFNLNDYEIKEKTHVMITLEDMFGLNNPLLQTPENLITSVVQKQQRQEMSEIFKSVMFTSTVKRDKLSNESKKPKSANSNKKMTKQSVYDNVFSEDKEIERKGFILVCDCTDQKTIEDLKVIIDKLHQIEKTNNLFYPKCILINKIDKADKERIKIVSRDLEQLKSKFKVDIVKTSALANYGIVDAFKRFISKIHQQITDSKQNEGLEDQEQDGDNSDQVTCNDKLNSCSKKVFCGNRIFVCGGDEEEEDEN